MTPNLVRDYKHAMQRVYGVDAYVPEKYNDRFQELEVELMEHHIENTHYAESQAVMWRHWVDKLGLTHMPLNLFLSIAAKSRYNKLMATPSIELILDRKTELQASGLSFERAFAEWYMTQLMYTVGVKDEEQALDTYLDAYTHEGLLYGWLDYCEQYGRPELIRIIIQQYQDWWHITKLCENYFQLACRYVDGLIAKERKLRLSLDKMNWRSREYSTLNRQLEQLQNELTELKHGSLA